MQYTSITSHDAASLANSLTEKATEGWSVVGIAGHGSSISAILSREGSATSAESSSSDEPSNVISIGGESSGWGSSSASAGAASSGAATGPVGVPSYDPGQSSIGSAASSASSAASSAPSYQPAPATPAVPAGWYADPAGRFELRYWDGSAWTEHVSRAGQQYTDPPVA